MPTVQAGTIVVDIKRAVPEFGLLRGDSLVIRRGHESVAREIVMTRDLGTLPVARQRFLSESWLRRQFAKGRASDVGKAVDSSRRAPPEAQEFGGGLQLIQGGLPAPPVAGGTRAALLARAARAGRVK